MAYPAIPRGYLQAARRDAVVVGLVVGAVVAVFDLYLSGVVLGLGVVTLIIGIVFSLTIVGAIIGIPLAAIGLLGIIAGIIGGSGGLVLAALIGVGAAYVSYRRRLRRV